MNETWTLLDLSHAWTVHKFLERCILSPQNDNKNDNKNEKNSLIKNGFIKLSVWFRYMWLMLITTYDYIPDHVQSWIPLVSLVAISRPVQNVKISIKIALTSTATVENWLTRFLLIGIKWNETHTHPTFLHRNRTNKLGNISECLNVLFALQKLRNFNESVEKLETFKFNLASVNVGNGTMSSITIFGVHCEKMQLSLQQNSFLSH